MARPKKPSPVTDVVLAAYRKLPGGTSMEIAALAGVRPEYVRTVLGRNGIGLARKRVPKPPRTTPIRKYRRLQDWERAAIATAYADGEKLAAIANEFNALESTVYRVARAEGIPKRNGPRAASVSVERFPMETLPAFRRRIAIERKRAIAARSEMANRKRGNNTSRQGLETAGAES